MAQTWRFLSKEDIVRALTVKDAIPLVREAFVQLSSSSPLKKPSTAHAAEPRTPATGPTTAGRSETHG